MKRLNFYLLVTIFTVLLSCEKEKEICGKRYDYKQSQMVYYSQIYYKGIISFYDTISYDTINVILKDFSKISYSLPEYSTKTTYVVVDIATKSCNETDKLFAVLKQNEKISDCSKWLLTSEGVDFGFKDIFHCKLKHDSLQNEMINIISETKTTLIKEDYDIFYLKADKNSKGDALGMANYFHESGYFEFTGPNRIGYFNYGGLIN